jgi:hypothetical protein
VVEETTGAENRAQTPRGMVSSRLASKHFCFSGSSAGTFLSSGKLMNRFRVRKKCALTQVR